MGAQVVRNNAELLHVHSTPPASESSIGGVDLIGAKNAAQARVRNATMSKGRFIAILHYFRRIKISRVFLNPSFQPEALLSGVGFSQSSPAGKMTSSIGAYCFMAASPTKSLHKIATTIRDADWRTAGRVRLAVIGRCHEPDQIDLIRVIGEAPFERSDCVLNIFATGYQ